MLTDAQLAELHVRGVVRVAGLIAGDEAGVIEARVWRFLAERYGARADDPATWPAEVGKLQPRRKPEQHRRQRKVENELGQISRRLFAEKPDPPGAIAKADNQEEGQGLQENRQHSPLVAEHRAASIGMRPGQPTCKTVGGYANLRE